MVEHLQSMHRVLGSTFSIKNKQTKNIRWAPSSDLRPHQLIHHSFTSVTSVSPPGGSLVPTVTPPSIPTRSDMQRWLGAFPTPGPLPCSPDTIYEDCECSQELCSEPSTPVKTEARILESRAPSKQLHKSPEGWLKGLPGAFPAQLVCEVTGEHERRKHLRQHQRLLEAVGPSSGTPSTSAP